MGEKIAPSGSPEEKKANPNSQQLHFVSPALNLFRLGMECQEHRSLSCQPPNLTH